MGKPELRDKSNERPDERLARRRCSDPGDDLDPRLMNSLEPLCLKIRILVRNRSDCVVPPLLDDLVGMRSDDDLVDQHLRKPRRPGAPLPPRLAADPRRSQAWRWLPTAATPPVVRRLGCLRGISTLTGFALAVEIGDWQRFTGATIGAFVGLVSTESSSGQSRSQGSITKTGNTHARRLLVEAAWHHAKPYRVPGKTMRDRWELAPPAARVRGHEGNRRLHQGWQRFNTRKKRPAVADVAIARELAGWAWSLAVLE
jgi:hypothetical protein